MEIRFKKLNDNAISPHIGSDFAAGADLYVCENVHEIWIPPHETVMIRTGIAVEIPNDCFGMLAMRSSLGVSQGLHLAQGVGIIDADYRGELKIPVHNSTSIPQEILNRTRIAQLVIIPYYKPVYYEVGELTVTNRGGGGFGSTGQN